jgi:hypothetical protein
MLINGEKIRYMSSIEGALHWKGVYKELEPGNKRIITVVHPGTKKWENLIDRGLDPMGKTAIVALKLSALTLYDLRKIRAQHAFTSPLRRTDHRRFDDPVISAV